MTRIAGVNARRAKKRILVQPGRGTGKFLAGQVIAPVSARLRSTRVVSVRISGGRTVDAVLSGKLDVKSGAAVILRRDARHRYRVVELLAPKRRETDATFSSRGAVRVLEQSSPNRQLRVVVDAQGLSDPVSVVVPARDLVDLLKRDTSSDLSSPDPKGLDVALWGGPPSKGEVLSAEEVLEQRKVEQRRAVLDKTLSRAEAAARVGVTPQTISDWRDQGDLLALRQGRELRFPSWQFDPGEARGIKVGIRELALAFGGSIVGLSLWATTPNSDFSDRTPAEFLNAATLPKVVSSARSTGHAW